MLICARIGCSCMLANSSFCTVWIFFSTSSISLLCELYFSLRSHLSAYKWPLLLFLADLQRLISTTTTTTNQTRSSSLAKAKRFCCSANSVGFRPSDDGIFHRNIAIHEASHIHTTHPNETKSEKKRREEKSDSARTTTTTFKYRVQSKHALWVFTQSICAQLRLLVYLVCKAVVQSSSSSSSSSLIWASVF